MNKAKTEFDLWLVESKESLSTIADIREWLLNGAIMTALQYSTRKRDWRSKECREFSIKDIKFNVRYSEYCSNSHSSPKGFPQNFSRNPDKPVSYPGFEGMVYISTVGSYPSFSLSSALSMLGINTGTGGCTQWDVKVFEDDFPALKAHMALLKHRHEELKIIAKLRGRVAPNFKIYLERENAYN